MLRCFSEQLGVSAESLSKLGVGYFPGEQAWVFPERDAKGQVIGLLKRYPDGKKMMVEGSSRGLTFIPSGKQHTPLLNDYIRVTDANVNCPICGKPDWCLVNRDDPTNPSSVICPRIEIGAEQRMGDAGWLHIRRKDADHARTTGFLIEPSDKPILIVEGASDVCAAYDLGFIAIGRPSAEGKIDILARLVKGRKVVVVGENDSGAGRAGMETTFNKLKTTCAIVSKIMPPPTIKDLREWYKNGLTTEVLLDWIKKYGTESLDPRFLIDASPMGVALQYLDENYIFKGVLTLRHHRGDFWKYEGGRYKIVETDLMAQGVYGFLNGKQYIDGEKTKPYIADKRKVDHILHALAAVVQIKNGKDTVEPFIIIDTKPSIDFEREKCVIFRNGILNIDTKKLTPLSPEFFLTSTLPYDYNPDMPCPLWEKTIREWFFDKDAVRLLQQWFGYNLIAENKFEKMMILFGVPASGKSTTTAVLRALLGPERCIAMDFGDLQYSFGLEQLIDKYAAILSEDQSSRRMGGDQVLQTIKRFTGRNPISVRRKFRDTLTIIFFARLTYETNELPHFLDIPQALSRRVLILEYIMSFEFNQNINLKNALMEEVQGIANWALKGLKDLLDRGNFIQPSSSDNIMHELRQQTSPIAAMIDECCILSPQKYSGSEQLYDLYKVWCKENGYPVFNKIWFGRYLFNTYKGRIVKFRPIIKGERIKCIRGLEITEEAFRIYLGKPK